MPSVQKKTAELSDVEKLRLIYFEIIDGFDYDEDSKLYIKHLSDRDSSLIARKREELFRFYVSQGVPHEDELLKSAIETGEWSQEKEDEILSLKYQIADNEKNIHNIIPEQRGGIEKIIEETRATLAEKTFDRKQILGRNVEDLVDDDVSDYVLFLSFFKDPELRVHVEDSYERFQDSEQDRLNFLNARLSIHYKKFSERNLKGVACLPMFINKLGFSKDNVHSFLGTPVVEITHNQSFILTMGVRNLNILGTSKGNPPDLSLDAKIDDVIRWYDIQHSINIGKKNSQEIV